MLKKFLIERNVPNAGSFSHEDFKKVTAKSNDVLGKLGADDIKWGESFVTDNKIYCVYEAANEDIIRKHAQECGIPADTITEIKETLTPDFGQGEDFYKGHHTQSPDVNLNFS
jgi:hypothetical protein